MLDLEVCALELDWEDVPNVVDDAAATAAAWARTRSKALGFSAWSERQAERNAMRKNSRRKWLTI